MRRFLLSTLSAALILMSWAGPSHALLVSGSSGSLSASADFQVVGGNLQVTLTNTSAADVLAPGDVLTAVFFNLAGNPTLTRVSAVLNTGSTVFYDPDGQPAGGVVGGEWAYNSGFSPVNGATQGISSTGLGLFGPSDLFPGPDLAPPTSPDGVQYGLLSAGDNTATGNTGITGSGGLILNSVVFTLSGLPAGFTEAGISNVLFQYGTDLSETRFPGGVVPEPSTVALALTGLVPLGLVQLRRRRR